VLKAHCCMAPQLLLIPGHHIFQPHFLTPLFPIIVAQVTKPSTSTESPYNLQSQGDFRHAMISISIIWQECHPPKWQSRNPRHLKAISRARIILLLKSIGRNNRPQLSHAFIFHAPCRWHRAQALALAALISLLFQSNVLEAHYWWTWQQAQKRYLQSKN
jgi:hypothetical protein